jgi:TetR/AcrR family transcriptional regulator, transcriptional repressor of aconitase
MPKVTEAHRAARRRQVLDAAAACFARQGFHRTTIRDIVSEADLSPGAVYGYFSSKADIIEAIAAERHARERDLILRARAQGDTAAILHHIARGFLGPLTNPEERTRRRVGVQVWAEALRDPRLLKLVRRGIDEPIGLLTAVIRESQARGEVSHDLEPEAAARLIVALFHGLILQQTWDPRVDVTVHLALIERVIDAAIARPQPARRRQRA